MKYTFDQIRDKISFPSYLWGTTLKIEVIQSIVNRQLNLCQQASKLLAWDEGHKIRDIMNCWHGVQSYLNGSRNWDSCKGINNPYLMEKAFIQQQGGKP